MYNFHMMWSKVKRRQKGKRWARKATGVRVVGQTRGGLIRQKLKSCLSNHLWYLLLNFFFIFNDNFIHKILSTLSLFPVLISPFTSCLWSQRAHHFLSFIPNLPSLPVYDPFPFKSVYYPKCPLLPVYDPPSPFTSCLRFPGHPLHFPSLPRHCFLSAIIFHTPPRALQTSQVMNILLAQGQE